MGGPAVDGWSSPRDDSPSNAVRMAPPVARPGWGPLPAVAPTALLTVEDCVSSMVWLFPLVCRGNRYVTFAGVPGTYGGVWYVVEAVNAPLSHWTDPHGTLCAGKAQTSWTAREPFTVQIRVSNMRSPSTVFSVSNYRYPRGTCSTYYRCLLSPLPGPVTAPHGFSHHTSRVASTSGWCEPVGVVTFTGGVDKVCAQMV